MPDEPTGFRVLIADDEQTIADTLSLILRVRGFEVETAYSGEMAVELAARLRPDVLISDVVMGGISGVEAALQIRRQYPDCRVILISGRVAPAELLEPSGKDGEVFEVLTKPVHPEVLLRRLESQKSVTD